MDAIGFTDHYTRSALGTGPYNPGPGPAPNGFTTPGRTLHGQLTAGDSNTSYTDDDGATHIQSQGGGIPQGPDHETFGAGPYAPTNLSAVPPVVEPPHPTYPNAVYYCTQNVAPEAECSRSDDGGLTFGPGIPIYNLSQCTGSIHGHVKVARDGTVYVPNYSCTLPTGNQGVAVSTDNGITWTEHNVPGSGSPKPGLVDPSVAVALNDVGKPAGQATNTIYFGFIDNDGTPKIAVSHDRGQHWMQNADGTFAQNVGGTFSIANSTFPVVVAGDDNRAAFGFLGTTTSGNSSLDANFPGIWHLYIATTYDGGNSWVTIDATPNDPVQVGPVCNGGTFCSTKRNLLDFNGFDVDSEGRGLLGLSDGCVNCTNTSSSGDSNAAQGLIARQSGGPRLFAAFDPPVAAAPAAPQVVSATQDSNGVLVSWLAPDNGGTPITAYNIYRGTASGGEGSTPIATVTVDSLHTQTKYFDTTATGNSPYFYRVTAVNSQGESPFCQELSVTPPVVQGNACTFPYLQVDGPGSGATDPTGGELTIQYVNIGEPFTTCTDNSLTFIMKVATLDPTNTGTAVLPENSEWQILFNVLGTDGLSHPIYVELDTFAPNSQALPGISIGRRDPCSAGCGTLDSSADTTHITASWGPDGTILFKLNASAPLNFAAPSAPGTGAAFTWDGRAAGTRLGSVTGNTLLFVGAGAGLLETVQTTGGGTYTRVGNQSCSSAMPIAQLSATPLSGNAPLTVTFNASGSHESADGCGTITSYTLNFGDGSTAVTQSSPNLSHTYSSQGDYGATLTVKDSSGKTSTNLAEQVITVTGPRPDLVISGLTSKPGEPQHGSTATLTATVKNQGKGNAGASQTQFFDGTTSLGIVNTAGLAPGKSAQVSLIWTTPNQKGSHTIKATADRANVVVESNETNNTKSITVRVK